MRFRFLFYVVCSLLLGGIATQAEGRSLEILFIDVEGGQATLIVSPSGQSMLVDTGWRGFDGRDADRIMQAVKAAKIKQIDYLVITHYHRDHVGGVPQLANRIKIGTFLDHGPNTEDSRTVKEDYGDYVKTFQRAEHLVLKPGDSIPLKGVTVKVVASASEHIAAPLPGAGQPNPFCDSTPKREPDASENARSVGFLLT